MTRTEPFVTAELDATQWANLEPLYRSLIERELRCEGCLEQLILDRSDLDALVSEAGANLYITMTRHTDDESANSGYEKFVQEVAPEHKKASFELDKKICDSPHAEKLDQDRYGVMLRETRTSVSMFREENIPIQTELALLEQKYNQIIGSMSCEFEGETRTMPQMGLFLEEQDRDLRERAWKSVAERRLQDRETLDELFNEMAAKRGQIAANAGFENFRDYQHAAMMRYDYSPADCSTFHEAIEKVVVPLRRKLDEERREALGVDTLRPWDGAVDTKGRAPLRPFKDADELVERSSQMFNKMDGELGAMFDKLRHGDCLDLETRQNKAPGGYQYNRDFSRMPFIFMNAAGLHRDVETMVHEAGHAFHSFLADHDPLVGYRHSPIEFAEVASMSMELLTYPYLGEFYDDVDSNRARREHLEAMSRTLSWIAQVDAFQHWIYLNPGHSSEDRRISAWRNARLCRALATEGFQVICATISMFEEVRSWARSEVPGYTEIYLEVPEEVRRDRDPKGLYRQGLSMAGMDQACELPTCPDLRIVNDGTRSIEAIVAEIEESLTFSAQARTTR